MRDWEWIDTSIPPLARDLKTTLGLELTCRAHPERDWLNVEIHITDQMRGTWTLDPQADPIDMRVWLADALAESWLDEFAIGWPKCPDHPQGAPLVARRFGERAIWYCHKGNREVAEIGNLRNSV